MIVVSFDDRGDLLFPGQAQAFPVGPWCYRFAGPAPEPRGRIVVRQLGLTEATRWTETLP